MLGRVGERDLRTLDLKLITRLFDIMMGFCNSPANVNAGATNCSMSTIPSEEYTSGKELVLTEVAKLGIQLLKSPNIKHKELGMSVFVRMKSLQEQDSMRWTNAFAYAKKLRELGFVEAVFGENANGRVILRTTEMLVFLFTHKELRSENLALIWRCCIEKHEDVAQPAFEVLTGLLSQFYEPVSLLLSSHAES